MDAIQMLKESINETVNKIDNLTILQFIYQIAEEAFSDWVTYSK